MIVIVICVLIFGFPTWLFMSWAIYDSGYKSRYGNTSMDEDRTKTNWNAIALILNVYDYIIGADWKDIFYPKSGIDKEIAEEEKEIAELERQKEKIETLSKLKRRKERLFDEVHSGTNADCKWCGEDDCLKPAYTVDGIAQYYCTSCHKWLYDGSPMYR